MKQLNYQVPDNMAYIFEAPDMAISDDDFAILQKLELRAKNLEKNNGALYPGLTRSAVHHLKNAYEQNIPVNKDAFEKIISRLKEVRFSRY